MTARLMIPWAYWRRHRVGLTALAGGWGLLATLAGLAPGASVLVATAGVAGLFVTEFYLIGVFCFAPEADFATHFLVYMLLFGCLAAAVNGVNLGACSTHLLTRPLTNVMILRLKARVALRGAEMGAAVVLIGYAAWLSVPVVYWALMRSANVDESLGPFFGEAFWGLRRGPLAGLSDLRCDAAAVLFLVGAVAWAWWAGLASLWVGLSCRLSFAAVTAACLSFVVMIFILGVSSLVDLAWLPEYLGHAAAVLLTAKFAAAVIVGRRPLRCGAATAGQVRRYVFCCAGVVAASLLVVWWVTAGLGVSLGVSLLLAAVPVPLNRVGVALLTLHAARHR